MKIILQGNWLPLAALIRVATFSRWHHAGVIIGDKVVEARALQGVVATPLGEFKKRGSWQVIDVPLDDEGKAKAWLYSQVGKGYDWKALLMLLIQRDWSIDEKWYCSELVAIAVEKGGLKLFSRRARGVLPEDLNKIPYEVNNGVQ